MATAFGDLLRRAGVLASADQLRRFIRAVTLTAPGTLDELYWVGRVTLVADRADIDTYERVFNHVFRGLSDWADTRGDDNAPPPAHTRPARDRGRSNREPGTAADQGTASAGKRGDGEPSEREIDVAVASREERLATTDFAELTDDELRELRDLMRQIRLSVPLRPARRHRRHHHGDKLDLRATLRRSRRSGGDPIEHITRRAHERPRKLVVLCDISGSMAPYSRACIQLLHAAAGGSRAEVFTFATRLTRLTRPLSVADPDAALAMAASTAPDWKGGTRIGAGLKEFLDGYGRRGVARGAVVVIVSDGWDRDDPGLVDEQMARLRRLAHRIVWINPRRAAPGFVPLAGGMAAALPYCDALVSGNSLVALRDAIGAIAEPR
jgi:uncharacterized protein with von Willebrand factor type A (vWA) domain